MADVGTTGFKSWSNESLISYLSTYNVSTTVLNVIKTGGVSGAQLFTCFPDGPAVSRLLDDPSISRILGDLRILQGQLLSKAIFQVAIDNNLPFAEDFGHAKRRALELAAAKHPQPPSTTDPPSIPAAVPSTTTPPADFVSAKPAVIAVVPPLPVIPVIQTAAATTSGSRAAILPFVPVPVVRPTVASAVPTTTTTIPLRTAAAATGSSFVPMTNAFRPMRPPPMPTGSIKRPASASIFGHPSSTGRMSNAAFYALNDWLGYLQTATEIDAVAASLKAIRSENIGGACEQTFAGTLSSDINDVWKRTETNLTIYSVCWRAEALQVIYRRQFVDGRRRFRCYMASVLGLPESLILKYDDLGQLVGICPLLRFASAGQAKFPSRTASSLLDCAAALFQRSGGFHRRWSGRQPPPPMVLSDSAVVNNPPTIVQASAVVRSSSAYAAAQPVFPTALSTSASSSVALPLAGGVSVEKKEPAMDTDPIILPPASSSEDEANGIDESYQRTKKNPSGSGWHPAKTA